MEYPALPDSLWQSDLSEMIVLMGLILTCLRRQTAPVWGMDRPLMPGRLAIAALAAPVPRAQASPLAPIPVPTPGPTN